MIFINPDAARLPFTGEIKLDSQGDKQLEGKKDLKEIIK